MIHFPLYISIENIIPFIILRLDYDANYLDVDWVNGNCQGKEFCDGWSLVEGINGCLLRDK